LASLLVTSSTYKRKIELCANSSAANVYGSPISSVVDSRSRPKRSVEDEYEPDDSANSATDASVVGVAHDHSLTGNDSDWHRFTLGESSNVVISVTGSLADEFEVRLLGPDSSSSLLNAVSVDDSEFSGEISRTDGSALAPGTYFVNVYSNDSTNIPRRLGGSRSPGSFSNPRKNG